jgi:hypothetical protein
MASHCARQAYSCFLLLYAPWYCALVAALLAVYAAHAAASSWLDLGPVPFGNRSHAGTTAITGNKWYSGALLGGQTSEGELLSDIWVIVVGTGAVVGRDSRLEDGTRSLSPCMPAGPDAPSPRPLSTVPRHCRCTACERVPSVCFSTTCPLFGCPQASTQGTSCLAFSKVGPSGKRVTPQSP